MQKNVFRKIGVFLFVTGLVACSKNDNNQPGPTRMRWINATPNMSFDIYSNSEKIASSIAFDSVTDYAAGLPSLYSLEIRKAGSESSILQGMQQLQSGNYYSMFILPDTSNRQLSTTSATVSIVTENTVTPPQDSLKLRFFNFAPYTPPINVVMTIDGRTRPADTLRPFLQRIYNDQATSSSYTVYKQFLAINWKIHLYNSVDSSFIDSFRFPNLLPNRGVYTLYLKAVPGKPTSDTIGHELIQRGY